MALPNQNISLQLYNITMAYTQSHTKLNRIVLAELPKEIKHKYPTGIIMVVVKPLYSIAEAGTY